MNSRNAYDVVIVGGGLVGASLAYALAPCKLKVAIVEAAAANRPARTVALTDNARRIYQVLGVWDALRPYAEPIREIHVSDRGHFGMTHLRAADIGAPALGYVLPMQVMGEILHKRLRAAAAVFCPATVTALQPAADGRQIRITLAARDARMKLRARLAVVADGGNSNLAAQLGVAVTRREYPQRAIVAMLRASKPHRGRAYERFTEEGPIALLPAARADASGCAFAAVWTSARANAAARMALSDAEFTAALQNAFGYRAGVFSALGARAAYPLVRARAAYPVATRAVLLGNAAHTVHPVAGQGFNLGLRDAALLAELIYAATQTADFDPGAAGLLAKYAAMRRRETARVDKFTDGLIKVFASRNPVLRWGRNIGLAGVEMLPPVKRFLLRRTMGLAGQPSRLGAGAPLAD